MSLYIYKIFWFYDYIEIWLDFLLVNEWNFIGRLVKICYLYSVEDENKFGGELGFGLFLID